MGPALPLHRSAGDFRATSETAPPYLPAGLPAARSEAAPPIDRYRDWWTSRRSSVPSGISSRVALKVSNYLDTHCAEQRCFPSIELGPEYHLPKGAHHALRSPGLEEVDGPERAGPIAEQLLELFR